MAIHDGVSRRVAHATGANDVARAMELKFMDLARLWISVGEIAWGGGIDLAEGSHVSSGEDLIRDRLGRHEAALGVVREIVMNLRARNAQLVREIGKSH